MADAAEAPGGSAMGQLAAAHRSPDVSVVSDALFSLLPEVCTWRRFAR
ncbi:MAG: hypothetical protein GY822_20280 [Deltaproteobacteria bacterium]|nr:hypothetical protein [Deltaproteobacteria bacterium]